MEVPNRTLVRLVRVQGEFAASQTDKGQECRAPHAPKPKAVQLQEGSDPGATEPKGTLAARPGRMGQGANWEPGAQSGSQLGRVRSRSQTRLLGSWGPSIRRFVRQLLPG